MPSLAKEANKPAPAAARTRVFGRRNMTELLVIPEFIVGDATCVCLVKRKGGAPVTARSPRLEFFRGRRCQRRRCTDFEGAEDRLRCVRRSERRLPLLQPVVQAIGRNRRLAVLRG